MATSVSPHELRLQAASLAFTLLRFTAGAAHMDRSSTPPGMLHTGTECYLFAPSWRRIPLGDVPQFLADLTSPALLTSTTTRGIATLTLFNELADERRAWAEKSLSNQQAGLEMMAQQLDLSPDAQVLLQFEEEEHWYPLAVLRAWCAQFVVDAGWSLRRYQDDARAQARLMLFRSDGARSWGDACPIRRRVDNPSDLTSNR
ncbi:MAG TPA: hypothetical protein VIP11_05965 [Gemmatimonadaceae bacterium]